MTIVLTRLRSRGGFVREFKRTERGFVAVVAVQRNLNVLLLHFGNPKVEREYDLYSLPGNSESVKGLLPVEGDYPLPIVLSGCENSKLSGRSSHSASQPLADILRLTLAPNPTRGHIIANFDGFFSERSEEIAPAAVLVYSVNGQLQSGVDVLPRTVSSVELQVSHLPLGLYYVRTMTTEGRTVEASFVKQ